jgi:chromosome segregation ATPase
VPSRAEQEKRPMTQERGPTYVEQCESEIRMWRCKVAELEQQLASLTAQVANWREAFAKRADAEADATLRAIGAEAQVSTLTDQLTSSLQENERLKNMMRELGSQCDSGTSRTAPANEG